MARLNLDAEETPTPSRESSLYRDPTPVSQLGTRRRPQRASTRETTYSVHSPTPGASSDKENQPDDRDETPRPARKGKEPMGPPTLPTPNTQHGNKRRRLGDFNIPPASKLPPNPDTPVEEYVQKQFYDPDQDPKERREVRMRMRENFRDMTDRKDELVHPQNNDLKNLIKQQNTHMKKVKQTSDAVVDSKFLVHASELALKKTTNGVLGDTAGQIDVDEFVSKCIRFMRNGGNLNDDSDNDNRARTSTQARRRQRVEPDSDEEQDENDGDGFDWAILGRRACFPSNKRPPCPNFLLGPLSVQKRVRVTQGRRGRLQTQARGPVTRPKSIEREDIEAANNTTLTHMVSQIRVQLKEHCRKGMDAVEAAVGEDASEEDYYKAMTAQRIRVATDGEAAVDLFDLIINPHSFGQTVENLFYVSFLIKEGNAKMGKDRHGLPILSYSEPRKIVEQREQKISRHQAVLALDYPMWEAYIKAYDIKEPLIPHRTDDEGNTVTVRGWYA
ncbi:Nse4-domain-containing protein [Lophium mytilinum]|uniref:Non-structural maintenance of chromosomes element 4 n=1 Tax=Lophium mytilinum TaxID=390894 RepID=A0A6A6R1I0_9PEZI|nr:Nse4-domain-containing protein [Lophium mytilinum]